MKLTQRELAEMIFHGFFSHWDFKSCEKVATKILAKLDEPEPVIEIGDTVKTHAAGERGVVIGIGLTLKARACVQFSDDTMILISISELTLVEKGPKVHTFEGLGVYNIQTGPEKILSYLGPPTVDVEEKTKEMLGKLCNNGKRYTTTLTEEPR